MKMLSRRTALAAAGTALAVTPLLAASAPFSAIDPSKVSPRIAALVDEYRRLSVESDKASTETGRLADAIKARGIVRPEGPPPGYLKTKAAVDASGYSATERREADAWKKKLDDYGAHYNAQPEAVRIRALEGAWNRRLDRKWAIVDEIVEIPAESFSDLAAQIEVWLEHSADRYLDGSIIQISVDAEAESFVLRLPSEISRLAGLR